MNRMSFYKKFAMLGLVALVAVCVALYSLYINLSETASRSHRELDGLALIQPLSTTIQQIQQHRGLSSGVLGGIAGLSAARKTKELDAQAAFEAFEKRLPNDARRQQVWAVISAEWHAIRAEGMSKTRDENFADHTRLINDLLHYGELITDEYGLTADPELDTFYLAHTSTNELLNALEQLGQIRAFGIGILGEKKVSDGQKVQMNTLIALLHHTLKPFKSSIEKAAKYNPGIRNALYATYDNFEKSSNQVIVEVESNILNEHFGIDPESFFAITTAAIDLGYDQLYRAMLPTSERLLAARVRQAEASLNITIGIALMLMLAVGYFMAAIYYATLGSIRALSRAATGFAHGDLLQRVHLETHDELTLIGDSFNAMAAELSSQIHARQQSAQYSRSLIEASLDPLLTISAQGKITDVNQATELVTGVTRDELIGSDFSAYFTAPEKATAAYRQAFSQGFVTDYPLALRNVSGKVFDVLYNASVYRDANGDVLGVFAAARDITGRNQVELALQRQLQFSHALNRIADVIAKENDANLILGIAAQIVGEVLGADRSLIYDISFSQHHAKALCEWLNPNCTGITPTKATYPLDIFIGGATEVARTHHWLDSHDDDINPHLLADGSGEILHRKMLIKSLLWFPFAFSEDGYYLLVLNQISDSKKWTPDETDFLDSVSHAVSIALEKITMLSERDRVEGDLRIAATAFDTQEGILISDQDNIILRVNRAFTEITGYSAEEVVGKNPRVLSSGVQDEGFYAAMWQSILTTDSWSGEIWNRRKSGELYPEHLVISAVKDNTGAVTNYVAVLSDITQRKEAEDKIQQLAFYDPLTGLPNRRLLLDRLQQALASSSRSGSTGALLFIDLDNFKALNDTLGHDMGDLLLKQVAQRLKSGVREGDTVARLGGDEFVLVLEDLSDHLPEAATQTESISEKILDALNQHYHLEGHNHRSTPSIGITLFQGRLTGVDELMKQADIAMYQAKKAGRNNLRFFDPAMQTAVTAHVELEAELSAAISGSDHLHLYYQIQVDAAGNAIGAEALVRWKHPKRGMISPAHFIPLAEESGLILPLGHWVLVTACKQLADWATRPETAHLTLAVNISAKQFELPDFVEKTLAVVDYFGVEPSRLKLEITEGMLLHNVDEIVVKMSALRAQGINFSLDDFGTGYSSLQYLKRLPLSQLKIDQSFVRDIVDDSNDRALVETIIAMAHSLDLDVIAEGVETLAQQQILLQNGCTRFQGYLFGRPQPVETFESALIPTTARAQPTN